VPDRSAAGAHRIGRGREANWAQEGGDGEVSEKPLEMRHFQVLTYPEEPELAPSWAAGVARDGKMRQTAPMGAVGCTIDGGQDGKTEILVETR
jgi:hypothetical protein